MTVDSLEGELQNANLPATPMTILNDERIWLPSEILQRYGAGERDFRGLEIASPVGSSDPEFRGANLEGADFSGCFIDARFNEANLCGARFAANVKCCTFDGANLQDAYFGGAAIDAASFDGAGMTGANFEGATAYGYTYAKGECPGSERLRDQR